MHLFKVLKTLRWALLIFFILIQSFVKDHDIDGREISFIPYEGFYFFSEFEIMCSGCPHCNLREKDELLKAMGRRRREIEWCYR